MLYALPLSRKLWMVLAISLNATENNDSSFSSLKALCLIFDLLVYDEKQLLRYLASAATRSPFT